MNSITLSPLSMYLALALNGLFSGLGSALGSYFATNHIIKKSESVISKLKDLKKVSQDDRS